MENVFGTGYNAPRDATIHARNVYNVIFKQYRFT